MDTVVSHHIRHGHKGSRVSYALGVLLLSLFSLTATSQSASTSTSDVAVLIQTGHQFTPNLVRAHHTEKNSFLQTWAGDDVRLWRRADTTEQWQLFRHWKNMNATWSHKIKGELAYIATDLEGMFELYDARSYKLLYRIPAKLPPRVKASSVYIVPGESGDITILRLRELDSQGRKLYSLHLAASSKTFAPWQPFPRNPRISEFSRLGDNLFAARTDDDKLWQLVRVDASGEGRTVLLPEMPTNLRNVQQLQQGVFSVAVYDDALRVKGDTGAMWHLFRITPRGEIRPIRTPGLEPSSIRNIHAISNSKDFIWLVKRGSKDVDKALLTCFYWIDSENHLRPVHKAIPGLPDAMRNFRVLAKGRVVGATEVDDANGNGIPGDWTWRLQDSRGDWRSPHDVLPDLKGEIWRMVDWLQGEGLGVQTIASDDGSVYRWHWYLHESNRGRWQAIDNVLPLPMDLQIDFVRDRRDNLSEEGTFIELVAIPDEQSPAETKSPVPVAVRNLHYMMRTEDGVWTSVRNVVKEHHPGLENHILSVNAIRNGLAVDIQRQAGEPSVQLFFYKNRIGQWVQLENKFLVVPGRTKRDGRPFPRVLRSEVLADGHLMVLHEQKDANWDGQDNDTQLLQAGDQGWRVIRARNALGRFDDQLRYDSDLNLLVRTAREDGEKHFFILDDADIWTDISSKLPDTPAKISSAFAFADGRGLSVTGQFDSNDNLRVDERRFYYRNGELWQDIRKSLPKTFPGIQTIIGAGGRSSVSVQEAHDANGNGMVNEWRHYYRHDDEWVDIMERWQDLPNHLSELRVSADGRVLTVREEGDVNGNDLPFELFAGVWSDVKQSFVPINSVVPFPKTNNIFAIGSLWNGRGLAIQVATTMPSADTAAGAQVEARDIWHLYQRQDADRWQLLQIGIGDMAEIRDDATGRLLALRRKGSERWELWTRKEFDSDFVRWRNDQPTSSSGSDSPRDIRLDITDGIIALKTHDLWIDGEERWEHWRQRDDSNGLTPLGSSATAAWFGLKHHAVSEGRIRFDNASHYLDGRQAKNVPQPAIWFHVNRLIPSQENILYAPEIISQALTSPKGTSTPISINALGYGPDGTVIVYESRDRHLVAAFSDGPVWIETRPRQDADTGASDLVFLVNQLSDGTERLARLDAPERWIWSYRHQDGRIYYADDGYFFNETIAASEILTFRVGMEVYSFQQFSSFLFRPDLLEERLGLPKRSLFELTPEDATRIELARQLAPERIDISRHQPPHIKVLKPPMTADEPFVDLKVVAAGLGIDKTSITTQNLGNGTARSHLLIPQGDDWQRLNITKRVSLVPGKIA